MGQEFRPQQFEADGYVAPPPVVRRGWSVAGARVAHRPVIVVSVLFGVAAALAMVAMSGALGGGFPNLSAADGFWPVSTIAIAFVSGAWLAGAMLAIRMLVALPRWDRDRALFIPRWLAALVAFGFGPLLAALFFVAIGLGSQTWEGTMLPAVAIAALAAALFAYARAAIARLGEMLLLSLFVWLVLLALPAFWGDPVSRTFAGVLLDLMRGAGLLS